MQKFINTTTRLLYPLQHFSGIHQQPYLKLTHKISSKMSTISKNKSLILLNDVELDKMHINHQLKRTKQKKQNQWKTVNEKVNRKYTVSLIGLPNSGKSTLFNCMIGESLAIVDKLAGLTRDRKEYNIMNGLVKVIDTPGVETENFGKNQKKSEANITQIKQDIFKQTMMAVYESDMIILVVDAKRPITNETIQLVKYINSLIKSSQGRNIQFIVACNKCDGSFDEGEVINQVYRLGLQQYFMCSGAQGTGIFQILNYISLKIPKELKQQFQQTKRERVQKFQKLIQRMKQEMKELQLKGVSIKQWEQDFRKINPQPENNEDLDYDNFEDYLYKPEETFSDKRGAEIKNLKMKNSIKICFVGRPNVGKSSIINQLIEEERLVVSDQPHTTRDSIVSKILYKSRKLELIDTAGLNTGNIQRNNEEYLKKVQYSTMLSVRQAHVVIYTMDAFSAFKIMDFQIIQNVLKEGRPILIAVNKWEAIKQEYKYKAINYLKKQIKQNLGYQLHGYPIVFISAKLQQNLNEMMDYIIKIYDKWNMRISTGMLNNWLEKFKKLDNLPKEQQLVLKINYIIQARVRPPHFIFFVNNKGLFKDNYLRFVTDNIAKEFGMQGVPARVSLRSTNKKQNKFNQQNKPKKVNFTKMRMEELKKKYHNFGMKE